MRKIISLICFLLPALAHAAPSSPQLRSDAPDQYVVVKGDNLWNISGKFFKDPWRWPYIWGMNKSSIKDPHWIYPGETIVLDRASGTLRIGSAATTQASSEIVKLSPQIRSDDSEANAIYSIPSKAIEPFLSQPLVVSDQALSQAPKLVGVPEDRVIAGLGDRVYAQGLSESAGKLWQVYRPGEALIDPDSKEVLGHEAIYLGNVEVGKFAAVSTATVTLSKQEINVGDRLIAAAPTVSHSYLPRAPDGKIDARIISIYGGVSQGGVNTVLTLNKGERDGLQNGHVLALTSMGAAVPGEKNHLSLPDEQYGLLFVFRTFEKVSYALVMQAHMPVQLRDHAVTP